MLKEHEGVVRTADIPADGLQAGDVGTIVHIYPRGEAFEVEFLTLDGDTAAVTSVAPSQVRPVSKRDITDARDMKLSA